ncbi:hypothetical protein TRVL_05553 [Trypanosoma vivax]|nr:hypothetical protein TRVL_05553 [Trypanosoma vivax]
MAKFMKDADGTAAGNTQGPGHCATQKVTLNTSADSAKNFALALDAQGRANAIKGANSVGAKKSITTNAHTNGCLLFTSAATDNEKIYVATQNAASGILGGLLEVDSTSTSVDTNGIRVAILATRGQAVDVENVSAQTRLVDISTLLTEAIDSLNTESGSVEQALKDA